jgi:hypothetical protein
MFRLALTGIVTGLFLASGAAAPARAEDAGKDVPAIIKKAIEAKGGEEALKKYPASTSKFKGRVSIMGMDATMTGTNKDQLPDKLRLDAAMKIGGQEIEFTQIVNGAKGWQGINGMLEEMDKDTLDEARQQTYVGKLTDLRGMSSKDLKFKSLGESKIDDKTAIGVTISSAGHRDISLFFDKDTGLLLKSQGKSKDAMIGEFKAENFYSDYKKVNGIMIAHKVKVMRNGEGFMEMEMTSVTLSEKIDDKEFTKP